MGQPAAKQGDRITATDTHLIQPSGPSSPVATQMPFSGPLAGNLSATVFIDGQPAATVGSTAQNNPPHVAVGGAFVNPPTNQGEIVQGSTTVRINGQAAARAGDTAKTCNDPVPLPVGTVVVAASTVFIGG